MGIRNNIKKTNFLPHDSDPNPGVTVCPIVPLGLVTDHLCIYVPHDSDPDPRVTVCPVVSVGEVTDYRGTEKASGVGTIFFGGVGALLIGEREGGNF